ncbi:uncharacterized protein HMPREF1541_02363 [Cyphellophora europaea CBS 101466]|uniref:Beta-lactamase-related domain-containing protein n=1 Tax=Cyphellophora europaea (strain CBS 101466) TaxID=1220924 RepID=W2S5H6_CYPE1|nr:uncharacterized protein HMPREF1541_02363 [Cyphellophora europaea CBS 101466]ETN43204.1 hypothetical protein HMPREF1541_02363 [Cyphellophora europaea CBS 101466]
MDSKLDAIFQKATAENALPGISAVVIDSKGNQLYHKAFGVNDISASSPTPYTTSTPALLWSCTKLVTSIAALQLLEQGKISIDDPVSKYVPKITDIPVMDGKDENGKVRTRPQKSEITIRHLFTHTAGFSYDFFHADTLQWRIEAGQQPAGYMATGKREVFDSPLIHEPGSAFHYGISVDWLGFVVEAISGLSLHDYCTKHIFEPLGMSNSSPLYQDGVDRLLVHVRGMSGKDPLTAMAELGPVASSEVFGGGHYLISTLDDYTKALAALMNKGTSPTNGATILKPETVSKYVFQDQLPTSASRADLVETKTTIPMLSNSGSLLPGKKLGWSCGLMLNLEDIPGGRRQNSGSWAGMGNLYYWLDPVGDRAGMVMTSVLPFYDETVLTLFEALEKVAYGGEVPSGAEAKTLFRVDA